MASAGPVLVPSFHAALRTIPDLSILEVISFHFGIWAFRASSLSAPAPAPAPASATAATAAPATSTPTALGFISRGRPDEGKVDRDCLVQQLCSVKRVDRGFGFWLRGVFDKSVTLQMALLASLFA